jgi:hypothetical protein
MLNIIAYVNIVHMAPKPTDLPRWADLANPLDVVEPPSGKKDSGFLSAEKPAHSFFNWLLNSYYRWILYLDTFLANNNNWLGTNVFNKTVTVVAGASEVAAVVANQSNPNGVGVLGVHDALTGSGAAIYGSCTGAGSAGFFESLDSVARTTVISAPSNIAGSIGYSVAVSGAGVKGYSANMTGAGAIAAEFAAPSGTALKINSGTTIIGGALSVTGVPTIQQQLTLNSGAISAGLFSEYRYSPARARVIHVPLCNFLSGGGMATLPASNALVFNGAFATSYWAYISIPREVKLISWALGGDLAGSTSQSFTLEFYRRAGFPGVNTLIASSTQTVPFGLGQLISGGFGSFTWTEDYADGSSFLVKFSTPGLSAGSFTLKDFAISTEILLAGV